MSDLPAFVIDRHGGTDYWHQASAVPAAMQVDRGLLGLQGTIQSAGREPVPADTTGSASR
jgi:hypothetical protein